MNQIDTALNVLNQPMIVCVTDPMTGVHRYGRCNTGTNDLGGKNAINAHLIAFFIDPFSC